MPTANQFKSIPGYLRTWDFYQATVNTREPQELILIYLIKKRKFLQSHFNQLKDYKALKIIETQCWLIVLKEVYLMFDELEEELKTALDNKDFKDVETFKAYCEEKQRELLELERKGENKSNKAQQFRTELESCQPICDLISKIEEKKRHIREEFDEVLGSPTGALSSTTDDGDNNVIAGEGVRKSHGKENERGVFEEGDGSVLSTLGDDGFVVVSAERFEYITPEWHQVIDAYFNNKEQPKIKNSMLRILQEEEYDSLEEFIEYLHETVRSYNHYVKNDETIERAQALHPEYLRVQEIQQKLIACLNEGVLSDKDIDKQQQGKELALHGFDTMDEFLKKYREIEKKIEQLKTEKKTKRIAALEEKLKSYDKLKALNDSEKVNTRVSGAQMTVEESSDHDVVRRSMVPEMQIRSAQSQEKAAVKISIDEIVSRPQVKEQPLSEFLAPLDLSFTQKKEGSREEIELSKIYDEYEYARMKLPECAEKSLLLLVLHFQALGKYGESKSLLSKEQLYTVFSRFKMQSETEKLVDRNVKNRIRKIEKALQPEKLDIRYLREESFNLLENIRPIDTDLLLQLVDKSKKAGEKIKGKDTILLLGTTGAGKSTTIHFLAGSEMQRVSRHGIRHIEPLTSNVELQSFITSPSAQSETRSVNAITLDASIIGSEHESVIVLCDTPGFGDTRGTEIDIANGAGVVKAVKLSRSVRPLVLFSQQSIGERLEGLTQLVRVLEMFMPNIAEQLNTLTYVFTKFTEDSAKELNARLIDKKHHMSIAESADSSFVALLDHLIEKTRDGIIPLNPIEDNRVDFLKKIVALPAIVHPEEAFSCYTTESSLSKLKDQLRKHKDTIEKGFFRGDIALANYKLEVLGKISVLLELQETRIIYEELLRQLFDKVNQVFVGVKNIFQRCLSEGNTEITEDLSISVAKIDFLCVMETWRCVHMPEESSLIERTQLIVQKFMRSLQESIILQEGTGSADADANVAFFEKKLVNLNKLKQFVDEFCIFYKDYSDCASKLKIFYVDCNNFIKDVFKEHCALARSTLKEEEFDRFVLHMDQIRYVRDHYDLHLGDYPNKAYGEISNIVKESFSVSVKTICAALQFVPDEGSESEKADEKFLGVWNDFISNIEAADIGLISKNYLMLGDICKVRGLHDHFPKEYFSSLMNLVENSIKKWFAYAATKIIPRLCGFGVNYYSVGLQGLIKNLDILQQIPGIGYLVSDDYHNIFKELRFNVEQSSLRLTRHLEQVLDSSFEMPLPIKYAQLIGDAQLLSAMVFYTDHQQNIYQGELESVVVLLEKIIQAAEQKLSAVAGDKLNELPKQLIAVDQLNNLVEVEPLLFKQSESKCRKICDNFQQKLQAIVEKDIMTSFSDAQEVLPKGLFLSQVFDFMLHCASAKVLTPEILSVVYQQIDGVTVKEFNKIRDTLAVAYHSVIEACPEEAGKALGQTQNIVCAIKKLKNLVETTLSNALEPMQSESVIEILDLRKRIFTVEPASILEEWLSEKTGKLPVHVNQLFEDADQVEAGQRYERIIIKIRLAEDLRLLDDFLPTGENYVTARTKLISSIKIQDANEVGELKAYAMECDFASFLEKYNRVASMQSERCAKILNELLAQVKRRIQSLSSISDDIELLQCPKNKIEGLVNEVEKLSEINIIAGLVSQNDRNDFLILFKGFSSGFIKKLERFFNKIRFFIKEENYRDVDKFLVFLGKMVAIFGESEIASGKVDFFKAKELLRMEGESKNFYEIAKAELIKLEGELKGKVKERNNFYLGLRIVDYNENPPIQHLKKLEELKEENSFLQDCYKQLHQAIVTKIKGKLGECKKEKPGFDIDDMVEQIKGLHHYLPSALHNEYAEELSEVGKDILRRHEEEAHLISDLKAAEDLRGLVDRMMKAMNEERYRYVEQLGKDIDGMMIEASKKFKRQLKNGELANVLQALNELWPDWLYYSTKLATKKTWGVSLSWRSLLLRKNVLNPKKPQRVCNEMITGFSSAIKNVFNELSRKVRPDDPLAFPTVERYFSILVAVRKLQQGYHEAGYDKPEYFYAHLIKNNNWLFSYKNLSNLFEKISNLFLGNQQAFEKMLLEKNFFSLRAAMDDTQKYVAVFDSIKACAEQDFFRDELANFCKDIQKCVPYKRMRGQLAETVLRLKDTACQKILENPKARSPNAHERIEFYREIYSAYLSLKNLKTLTEHIDEGIAKVNSVAEDVYTIILENLKEIKENIIDLIARIPSENKEIYSELGIWYDNLRLAVESFENDNLARRASAMMREVELTFSDKIGDVVEKALKSKNDSVLIANLINFKLITLHASNFKKIADNLIDKLLLNIKQQENGARRIAAIASQLNKCEGDHQGLAQMLIADHKVFSSYSIELRNEKTLRFGVDYVLDRMSENGKNIALDVDRLKKHYTTYEKIYHGLVDGGLLSIDKVKIDIVRGVKLVSRSHASYTEKIIKLTAGFFAYWTLSHAEGFIAEEEGKPIDIKHDRRKNGLMWSHAMQVISIFRLLGLDLGTSDALSNHLVQIGTGEGKSVTLAVTASILALLGYEVDCACYSDYLSRRDYQDFADFFSAFDLRDQITYGTFNKLCENFINQRADVRDAVVLMIKTGAMPAVKSRKTSRDKIILIDEVDVFFNQEFYGNFYRPLAELHDSAITALIHYIWKIKDDRVALRLDNVKLSAEFRLCCKRFPRWEFLLEEAVKAMIIDVQTFHELTHVVWDDKIAYKEQHDMSAETSYGYKTTFAYFYECERGEITKGSRDLHTAWLIDCGAFSYAEVPKQYKCVMGVTGTLATLSRPEKELLEAVYGIKKFSYMPSVYGDNQLKFGGDSTSDVVIESEAGHFMAIVNEIKKRQIGELEGVKRAIMVFFESYECLDAFYNSTWLANLKNKVKQITTDDPADLRSGLIRQAATAGNITLLTREFGRGTDFICYDSRLDASGGVHVIQTFVSDELSEETQIKGRTARQGNKGSYSMVLSEESLERYQLKRNDVERMKAINSLYTTIHKARSIFFEQEYQESLRHVSQLEKDHLNALGFIDSLLFSNHEVIRTFLFERNQVHFPVGVGGARTICLMDATGSMSHLITKAKNTVQEMFRRAYAILEEKGMHSVFELQFAVYRNYSSPTNELLETSAWETDPRNLEEFMAHISSKGGQGNEAIEIGLWHVNREIEKGAVSQVILIGDKPPNERGEIKDKRQYREHDLQKTDFANPTYYEDELNHIIEAGVPVHAFYVDSCARSAFEHIAKRTEGLAESLDINSSQGAVRLTDLVTEQVLNNLGGETLVKAYRDKYVKGYVAVSSASSGLFSAAQSVNQATATSSNELPYAYGNTR